MFMSLVVEKQDKHVKKQQIAQGKQLAVVGDAKD